MIIDGIDYKVEWLKELEEQGQIINGDNSGRKGTKKDMFIEYCGTFINYKGTLVRKKEMTDAEWDKFINNVIRNPINTHYFTVPFRQGEMYWRFYIASYVQKCREAKDGHNKWSNTVDVQLVPMTAQWKSGQSLKGYSEY